MPATSTAQLAVAATPYADVDPLRFTADGKVYDFLEAGKTRPATPEERVRQVFARRLHYEYGYAKELLAFEVQVQIGVERKRVDIAIFRSAHGCTARSQADIALLVETKAPDKKSGRKQLESYIFATSAEGGVWANENDAFLYLRRLDGPSRLIEWPNIPRWGFSWDSIGKHTKALLRPPHDLVETFRRCHNALYKVGIDAEDLAMDMVRMVLAKYRDEQNEGETCEFRCTALEQQSQAGRHAVAERVRDLFRQVRDNDPDVFDPREEIGAGDREIAIVVSELQDFRFVSDEASDDTFDIVGAAYEVYVGSHLKGDRGQYFTPRLIVQLTTRLVNPSENDIVLDPSMGSGGFLITAMRHVARRIRASNRSAAAKAQAIRAARHRLFGIDKSPKLVKVARTNMILASDGHAGLVHGDTLEPLANLPDDFRRKAGVGRPTVILTNPPFGASSDHRITIERHPEILSQFDVGRVWMGDDAGRLNPTTGDRWAPGGVPPEYLFLERNLRWLAPRGRLGIVLPRGILVNGEALPLRTMLLREARVLAVVNCHDDSFKPHTDAKAAVLVVERKEHPGDADPDYPIFMAVSQAIGHNGLGEPVYRRDAKGDLVMVDGHPVVEHDLEAIWTAWREFQEGRPTNSPHYFATSRAKLAKNLDLNPVRYLPKLLEARRESLELGDRDGWRAERLGNIARVYNGPRFKRPYADNGVTSGPSIHRYFTGNAITQTRGENVKYLDLDKAKPVQLRMIAQLRLRKGMILVTDSGTIGRVVYATDYHEGAIGTNNLIRVEVEDLRLRGYVYQFLVSRNGQDQLKRAVYGAIVDHIEPADVQEIVVPIPPDDVLERVGQATIDAIEHQEAAYRLMGAADEELRRAVSGLAEG